MAETDIPIGAYVADNINTLDLVIGDCLKGTKWSTLLVLSLEELHA